MRMIMKAALALFAAVFVSAANAEAAQVKCHGAEQTCAHITKKKVHKHASAKSKKALHSAKKSGRKIAHAKPSKKVAKKSSGGGSGYQSGVASWYGGKFHGRQTANGERYNQNALTAAHRTLPFGTRVRVTNTANGDSVVVRINDRGPFVGGRVIDLSRAAASSLGIDGLGRVKIAVLGKG